MRKLSLLVISLLLSVTAMGQITTMKNNRFNTVFIFLLFALFTSSCNDDDDNSIQLLNVENNTLFAKYPSGSESYSIGITGGDGSYSVECGNTDILEVSLMNAQTLVYKPLGIGETTVTITDQSGNSYILNVDITYHIWSFETVEHSAKIVGDNLTIAQHREIEEKVFKTIPVAVGGGYQFIQKETLVYTNEDEQEVLVARGEVFIYTEKYGGKYIEGTFERKEVFLPEEIFYSKYEITTNEYTCHFLLFPYSGIGSTKSSPAITQLLFTENLTEVYKGDYPNLESALSMQVVKPIRAGLY